MKKSNLQFYCAASVLLLIIGASILAPLLVTHNPFEPDMANRLQPPSWQHFFGTDALGRDMFSRILYGGRASILLSLASAILSLGVGLVIGLFCGFYGGKLDMLCTVSSNIFQGIPGSCFMIAIAGIFGPSIKSLVLALVITSWAGFSRIVRAEVMQLKEEPFIEGLRCLGCSDSRLLLHHIIPNIVNKLHYPRWTRDSVHCRTQLPRPWRSAADSRLERDGQRCCFVLSQFTASDFDTRSLHLFSDLRYQ